MALTKAKYIEKYGEEAWITEAQKRSERDRKYYENNKDKKIEYIKSWQSSHKEERAEYLKNYYTDNKEKFKEKNKQYRECHRGELVDYFKRYYTENKDDLLDSKRQYRKEHRVERNVREKEYRKTLLGRASSLLRSYRVLDNKSERDKCTLTTRWIIDNIFNSSCVYCGDSDWTHLGADRIDNSKPHTPDNVVCACGICNMERSDKYTVEEFKKYRALHPRVCDAPKGPTIVLSETGALKKRAID